MFHEINESECFAQTIELETNESDRFTLTRASIHLFALLSETYIQKKTFRKKMFGA